MLVLGLDQEVLAIRCLWYGALKGQLVQVILSRPIGAPDRYELALVTTDLAATPAQVIERYADRRSEETSSRVGRFFQVQATPMRRAIRCRSAFGRPRSLRSAFHTSSRTSGKFCNCSGAKPSTSRRVSIIDAVSRR